MFLLLGTALRAYSHGITQLFILEYPTDNQLARMHNRIVIYLFIFMFAQPTLYAADVDYVLVAKSEMMMYLLSEGEIVKQYAIVLGANPIGHKQHEGDERTPEGKYVLDYKKSDSAFYKAIHISYPNDEDKARATQNGVNPGGLIMIHGQRNGLGWLWRLSQNFNWTNGCIAVTNDEMDQIMNLVKVGTPIEIRP